MDKLTQGHYQEAIAICAGEYNWKAIAIRVAQENPALFIWAAGFEDWRTEALRLYKEESKVAAIKHCRANTGMGLREAKEAVEALWERDAY